MTRRVLLPGLALLLSAGFLLFFLTSSPNLVAAPPQAVPVGFTDAPVTDITDPTALAFTPDGRMLITTQPGDLRIYQNGTLLATPALSFGTKACSNFERGLLGVAVDPAFATNQYIYLYYTFNKSNGTCPYDPDPLQPVNRVSRFTLLNTNLVDPASELVLMDNMPSPGGNHNAGDLHFGPTDGYLYISVGDGGCKIGAPGSCAGQNTNARRLDIPNGKILRISSTGTIPGDNPYASAPGNRRCGDPAGIPAGTGPCSETFSWGLRNPFRFAFKPGTATFHINDVGQDLWEEIDLGQKDFDYGWNNTEGPCVNNDICNPPAPTGANNLLFYYLHNATGFINCVSITGGAFVPAGVWPTAYDGAYLFSDYGCGRIFQLVPPNPPATTVYSITDFATGLGGSSAVDMAFGPYNSTQALYYTTYAGGGAVRRISYSCAGAGANCTPTAAFSANPASGPNPLTVNFSGAGSSDPNPGDILTYLWDFGDGQTAQTSTSTTSHVYNNPGGYTATLRVRDNANPPATSDPVTVRVNVGLPQATILSPASGTLYRVGQTITLTGSATDVTGATIPATGLSWQVLIHHFAHTHPYFSGSGNNLTFTAPPPEDLAATQNSNLEIQLTATDSRGSSVTVTRTINPKLINVTFNTAPTGLNLTINGTVYAAPQSFVSWEGYALNVIAANQSTFTFFHWSDNGAASHQITTPAGAATYTATFTDASCNAAIVTETGDNATTPTCGMLRYAINQASPNAVIGLAFSTPVTISLSDTLVITKPLTIQGVCSPNNGPQITLDGTAAGPGKIGLDLRGGVNLFGLKIIGFRGTPGTSNSPHIKLVRTANLVAGNRLQCVKTSR